VTSAPPTELDHALDAFNRGDLDRARSLAERGLERSPTPQLEHLVGLVHCRLGDLSAGVEHLRAAADAEPGNAAFQLMLARALVDCGRGEEVLALPEPPPVTSPPLLALWQVRAEAADAVGNAEAAVEAWSRVSSAAPRDWRAFANLANAQMALGRWSEAGDSWSKAAGLNPSDLSLRRNAGSALARAERLADALPHFAAVAAADPNDIENRVLHAQALAALQRHDEAVAEFEAARALAGPTFDTEIGLGRRMLSELRYDEAESYFRRAYEMEPSSRTAVHQLGLVLERTNRLDALAELLEQALARGIGKERLPYLWAVYARRQGRLGEALELLLTADPQEEPIAWNRLRAKIADESGDAAAAFEASVAMNKAAQAQAAKVMDFGEWERNAIAYREDLHALARTITPGWAARVPAVDEPSPKRIAFLVGFPRSGTTLLDTFLMGHPQVTVLEEEQLVGRSAAGLQVKDLPSVGRERIRKARESYLEALADRVGADFDGLVIDKFPLDMASAPLIHAMFPDTRFIFAQRHPCDVVLSGFMQSFGLVNFSDVRDAADYYDAMMSIWTASRDALGLATHTVVYEELVADPESTLKPVIEFLGLEWDDSLLDHRKTAKSRGTIVTPSYDQVTEPLTSRAIGRWKRYEKELEPVLPLLLSWAERLGYRD
jgi:tetratricopeptide (TPR) repeat protein